MNIPVLSPQQSAEWDRRAEASGSDLASLMETAGRAVAGIIASRFPGPVANGVLVAAGLGNNGGDGWVVARALHRVDVPVWVAPLSGNQSGLARHMAVVAQSEGVRVVSPDGPWPNVGLLVDAILGTGAKGPLRDTTAALVDRINDLTLPVAAIDGPTGVDLETGASHGAAVRAAVSITFGGLRRGHLLARDEVGDVVVVDIGHPAPDPAWPSIVTDADSAQALDRFESRAHKGTRGHVVVIGGDAGMSGALRLSCRAAFAAGAGLVHAVAPDPTIDTLVIAEPDLQTLRHEFTSELKPGLSELLARSDVLVMGPGLGRGDGRLEFVLAAARKARAAVLDADALNAFQGESRHLRKLAKEREVVLTPHPGEFRRLFPEHSDGLELDPWRAAQEAAHASGCTVLLKGVPSVVATSNGTIATVAAGNPGLATGGSGDVLSGIIGAFLAQQYDTPVATCLGAQVLGRAADLAARRTTARGLRPMDVIGALPDLWRTWEAQRTVRPAPRPPILFELESPQRW